MDKEEIQLPQPNTRRGISIEEALKKRRSQRNFPEKPLTFRQVSQLLWAAQGITDTGRMRSAPSAGATYPLEVYILVKNVEELDPGIYHFNPDKTTLTKILSGDKSSELMAASLGQNFVETAAINLVFAAVYERTTDRYGDRGERYVHMEVGHAGQNVYLQCESLGLGTVFVGAFDDEEVANVLNLPEDEKPLYIMPVGHKN
jgi:SagB-type dehydrogenase family enzyme